MANVLATQQALKAWGFEPGPIDGVWGRRTAAAVADFRQAIGLGGPAEIDQAVTKALFKKLPEPPHAPDAPWFVMGYGKLLQHERLHNAKLWSFMRFGGRELGDPSRHPWCGDFVETCIAVSLPDEPLPANPFLARNWMEFGRRIDGPRVGAIVVLWRGSRSGTKGHVGFYFGEDDTHCFLLGGNQGDRVRVSRMRKDRILGFRWPKTADFAGPQVRRLTGGGAESVNEA